MQRRDASRMFTLKRDIALRLTPKNKTENEDKLFATWVQRFMDEVPAHKRQGRRGLELLVVTGSESATFVIYDNKQYWSLFLDEDAMLRRNANYVTFAMADESAAEELEEWAFDWLEEVYADGLTAEWVSYTDIPGLF